MKKGKKKSMALAAGVLAALTLLSSCGTKDNGNQGTASGAPDADVSQSVPAGNTGDTLRVIITGEPVTIMPLEQEAGEGQWIAWCIYDRLVNYDAATGVLTPALATSWEWVDDTHLRFHLRDDVKAYDGSVIRLTDTTDRGGGRQTVRLQGLAPGRTKVTLSFRNVTGGPQIVVTTTVTVTE